MPKNLQNKVVVQPVSNYDAITGTYLIRHTSKFVPLQAVDMSGSFPVFFSPDIYSVENPTLMDKIATIFRDYYNGVPSPVVASILLDRSRLSDSYRIRGKDPVLFTHVVILLVDEK